MGLPKLSRGQVLGDDFKVERLVGAGGMGAIYLARQLSTGRKRALKLMRVDFANDPKLRERFAQEASVGSRIKSEHVVEVVAAGLDEKTGFPWLAMEYLEGEDLWAHLGKRGPLALSVVLDVLKQVCHALGAAHRVGIVHRDLKPANIFLSRSNRADVGFTVKVLDFGLAKAVADTTTMTEPLGTLLYMAPEQLRGRGICPATDVWALGLIAFELLTAKEYWLSAQGPAGLGAIADEIKQGTIIPASERARELGAPDVLPSGFDQWFARCCAIDTVDRFPDASSAFAALDSVLRVPPGEQRQVRPMSRSAMSPTAVARKEFVAQPRRADAHLRLVALAACCVCAAVLYAAARELGDETAEAPSGPDVPTARAGQAPLSGSDEPRMPTPGVASPAFDEVPRGGSSQSGVQRAADANADASVMVPELGYLTILCVPGCDAVTAGGRNLGPSPVVRTALPPGQHGIGLHAGSVKKSLTVMIVPGQTAARRVTMD